MKRLIKKGKLYKLIQFSQPVIVNNTEMLSDNNKGGILLCYKITEVKYISLFKYNYILNPKLHIYEKIFFFKPLKKDWNREAYKISQIYWGRKHHLLTRLWLIVDKDFKDIFSVTKDKLKTYPQCKDKKLIKQLDVRNESFILSNIKTDQK